MLGLDDSTLIAIGANVITLIGAYIQIIQRLTRLESEQRFIADKINSLYERRKFDRDTGQENF